MVRRKMTLLDAMILIAALAVAIAWTQAIVPIIRDRGAMDSPMWRLMPWQSWLMWWTPIAVPGLMTGSLSLLLLRIRSPRPTVPEMARQPGAAACMAATAVLALQMGLMILGKALAQLPGMSLPGRARALPASDLGLDVWFLTWRMTADLTIIGYAVMGAWLILALVRTWAAEPSLIDRAGRLVGIGWLLLMVAARVER